MDEWMLNDLLECSVCLERLDTSSKVLPCQHTFCKKCLEEIVTTHKELRCPECRVLVDIKIDDLPPNVLLMRILEGMRNAAPKKRNSGTGVAPPAGNRLHMSPPHHQQHYQHQQHYHQPHPPQQPPPSQQQHLPTLVSSSGSNNLPSTNPILQIPRFCYTPNQHILLPRLGKNEGNNLQHAVPATITMNHSIIGVNHRLSAFGYPIPGPNPNVSSTGCTSPNVSGTGCPVSVPNPNVSSTGYPISISNPTSNPNPPATPTTYVPNSLATIQTSSALANSMALNPSSSPNFPASSTAYNPNSSTTSYSATPSVATSNSSTKTDPKPRSITSTNNQHQLFYSFPQARLVSSAGGITSTQIVQHGQINTIASSAGLTSRQASSSVVSTHTSNGLNSSASLTQTCPHSYPGFGSISTVGIVPPRTQQHNSYISTPSTIVTSSAPLSNSSVTGQQRLSTNSMLPQSTSKPSSVQGSIPTSQNYMLLSNAMSSSSQGIVSPKVTYGGASGVSSNQAQSTSSLANVVNQPQNQANSSHSSVSSLGNVSSVRNVVTTKENVAIGNTQSNSGHASNAPLTATSTSSNISTRNQVSSGTSIARSATSPNLSTSTSTVPSQTSSLPKDKLTDAKDAVARSRPNSVYQYSQLADCLSVSSVLPTSTTSVLNSSVPTNKTDSSVEGSDPPPPPIRSESIAQTNSQQQVGNSDAIGAKPIGNTAVISAKPVGNTAVISAKPVGNTAVIGAKTVGNTAVIGAKTDSSVTALPSTAANQSVPLIKGINQPCARAVYDYLSKMPGDLSFKEGDLIILRRKIDNNWYHGECRGQSGVFPLSYVQILTPLPNHIPQCKALFDFRMNNDDEEGCLTFNKGDVVTVIRRVDENWAEGRLGERIGIFPLAFVELNNVARALMKLSINSQPGPSRLAPPTPTVDSTPSDATPLINTTDHPPPPPPATTTNTTNHSSTAVMTSDGSTSTTLTSPSSSSTSSSTSSSSSTSPPTSSSASSPSSPPPPTHQQSAKRHSFNALQHNQHSQQNQQSQHSQHSLKPPEQQNNRHSAEILTTSEPQTSSSHGPHSLNVTTTVSNSTSNTPVHSVANSSSAAAPLARSSSQRRHHQRSASADAHPSTPPHVSLLLPATYVALYPYKPQKSDELELKRGNVYTVTERCQDGWFKGTNKHQKCGVFPGNYVAPSKSLPAVQAQLRGIGRIAIVGGSGAGGRVSGTAANAAPSPEPRQYLRLSGGAATQNNARLLAPGFGNVVGGGSSNPPELPPRSVSPGTISSSWHSGDNSTPTRGAHNMSASVGSSHHDNSNSVGRNSPITVTTSPPNVTVTASKSSEKVKEKKERTSGGGIMRIFSMKKSPPPPTTYSMDNPVFEDGGTTATATTAANLTTSPPQQLTPVHVRSGSCPSQLLQVTPSGDSRSSPSHHHHHQHHHHRLFSPSSSQRLKHKERPSVVNGTHFASNRPSGDPSFQAVPHHRKSNSLDASATLGGGSSSSSSSSAAKQLSKQQQQLVPVVRERFRCIVPYPPNSDYELELQVGDLIYVHRKREDGWYKGTQQRTGKTGLFPASFVESF